MIRDALLPRLAWAIAGAVALWALGPSRPVITYPDVIVPAARILEREPDTVVRWRERIVTRVIQPDQVATAEDAATDQVAAFCRESVQVATEPLRPAGTVVLPPAPSLLLRSVSNDPGYFLRPDRVTITGPLSSGDLRAFDFTARRGWSARVHGDSIIFRQPRFQVLRDLGELAVPLVVGYGMCQAGVSIPLPF